MENLYSMEKSTMEINNTNLSKIFCIECEEEITDRKEMCWFHKSNGIRIYRHKECHEKEA